MLNRYKKVICVFVIIIIFILIWTVITSHIESPSIVPDSPTANLEDHHIYKNYNFEKSDNIINVGIQPLWLPPGIITETIRRDKVLQNALSEAGMQIRFYAFFKGSDVNYFLGKGILDAGIGGDMPALSAASHYRARVVAMTQQGFCSIVARKRLTLRELQGKRIGIAYGSNAHFALIDALSAESLAIDDIKPVFLNVTEMPQALANNQIDAFSAWEPTPSLSLHRYSDHIIVHRSLSTGYLYVSDKFFQDKPQALNIVISALLRSFYWLSSNNDHLRKACVWTINAGNMLSGESLELPIDRYMELASEDLLGTSSNGLIPVSSLGDEGSLAREFEFLKVLGKVPPQLLWKDVSKQFDSSLTIEILRSSSKYKIKETDYSGVNNESER
jgi:NitT/TauT family transport system substrate-binding protein